MRSLQKKKLDLVKLDYMSYLHYYSSEKLFQKFFNTYTYSINLHEVF